MIANRRLVEPLIVGEDGLRCGRCHGRMIPDTYHSGVERFWEWKCMSCGEVVDPLVLSNRAKQNVQSHRARRDSSSRGENMAVMEL